MKLLNRERLRTMTDLEIMIQHQIMEKMDLIIKYGKLILIRTTKKLQKIMMMKWQNLIFSKIAAKKVQLKTINFQIKVTQISKEIILDLKTIIQDKFLKAPMQNLHKRIKTMRIFSDPTQTIIEKA